MSDYKEPLDNPEHVETPESDVPQMFGHPKGLFYLFFAELWERFSFYGMRALLTLYMVNEVYKELSQEDADEKAIGIYAAYGALVYATPVIGGMIADRLIGYRKSIMFGGILMALGHFLMAFTMEWAFFGALGLLIVGNGFFKPNISSFVGALYKKGDPARDGGFTIFYMGINLGAFLAPLLCGWLGETYGWHYGFGLAGIGMLAGLVFFYIGQQGTVFGDKGHQPEAYRKPLLAGLNVDKFIYAGGFLVVPICAYLVFKNDYQIFGQELMGLLLLVVLAVVAVIVAIIMFGSSRLEIGRMFVIVFLTVMLTTFWAFFEQAGSSLTLFAERNVNLGWMKPSQTNSINPFYIILLAIPFSMMWTFLHPRRLNPNTPIKYALGIAQLGLGFLIFAFSAQFMDANGNVPLLFLVLGYLFITTGELFVSPIGLSKVTELSPAKFVGFFMGVFFLSSAFAHYIAGVIAKLTAGGDASEAMGPFWGKIVGRVTGFADGASNSTVDGINSLANYTGVFTQIGVIALIIALVCLLMSPIIKKLMGGIH